MSPRHVNCGYVPLVDCAPLIIARELTFAADEGLELNLLRQPSWAALRDLLALGHLDAAHMLSPMPAAMSLGLSGMTVQVDAHMVLSVNGTVFGVSKAIAEQMRGAGWNGGFNDPRGTACALLRDRNTPLRVGVPFPFSMHRLLFEYWMSAELGVTDQSFEIITTPPPLMADAVGAGALDVFCVGEPWGSIAVEADVGELILPGAAIWQFAPEKVLGMRRDWADQNQSVAGALMRAVYRAAEWLDTPGNAALACEILARSEHLDLSQTAIDHALSGNILTRLGGAPVSVNNFLKFHRAAANFPWRSQAAWIANQIAIHQGIDPSRTVITGEACFRPDLYRDHLASSGVDLPGASSKLEGGMQHRTAVASTRGHMILGPDAFFDSKTFEFAPND